MNTHGPKYLPNLIADLIGVHLRSSADKFLLKPHAGSVYPPTEEIMSNKIRVVALVNVRPERLQEAFEAFEPLIAATRQEGGCITYEMLQNVEDPYDLTFVEEWESPEALLEHFETEHFRAIVTRADELFTAPPDIRRYTLIK